ncbi:MAG: hypothetical protein OXG67_07680, partial [bacterium]|nr:hypothetical protein [bacterium]
GGLPAYRMGRVIRVKQTDVDEFIEHSRIEPGTLGHLYPDPAPAGSAGEAGDDGDADADS